MKRLRILQVTPSYYPATGYGGGPLAVYEISKRLQNLGHIVTVFTTDADDRTRRLKANNVATDGIQVHYFKNLSNFVAYKYKLFLSPGIIKAVHKEIAKFDIIHLHDLRTVQNIILYYYASKNGIPYVIQTHGVLPHPFNSSRKRAKYLFDKLIGYRILRETERVFALNNVETKQFSSIGVKSSNIEIIPTGIDLNKYKKLPQRGIFREKYNIAPNAKLILFVGRIHESKGLGLLLKAHAELVEEIENTKLVIVGQDDGHLISLKALIANLNIGGSVIFTGRISDNDKICAYVDADVFVTPSFYGFPATFLESMICGLPIITTDKEGYIDTIDNQAGFVVRFDQSEMKKAIIKLLTDSNLNRQYGEYGEKLVRNHYDWDAIVRRIEKTYYDLVKKA